MINNFGRKTNFAFTSREFLAFIITDTDNEHVTVALEGKL